MLYIFHLNTGDMLSLDMRLATESVQTLKEYVCRNFGIPVERQVYLMTGGVFLEPTRRVCSYPAGTDSTPIYLCTKIDRNETINQASTTVLDFREEEELIAKAKVYQDLPPSYQTVNKRATLAQQFSDSAIHLQKFCERLVSHQHIQHLGWTTVTCNFDEVKHEFRRQFEQLESDFKEYLHEKEYFTQVLHKFKSDIKLLRKIPVLPKLLRANDNRKYLMETSTGENMSEETNDGAIITLYDWIGKDEYGNDLEMLYEKCLIELNHYEQEEFERLAKEVEIVSENAEDDQMNSIGGVEDRFYTLDLVIQEVKKVVKLQTDLATGVTKNQNRLLDEKDASILPDLCSTHIHQFQRMMKEHEKLLDICCRCVISKRELNYSLCRRLKWAMNTQNDMQRVGDQMDVFSENIARLRYQLGVLEQVSLTPAAYLSYIAEIVRRRSFSQNFLVWASEIACRLLTIHNDEVARRKDFQSKYEEHFIQALFPGMEDVPPGYGIQAPSYFDTGLPKLTREDVDFMKRELPEMADFLNACESQDSPYSNLFKSVLNTDEGKNPEENLLQEVVDQIEIPQKETSLISVHGLPHLKDIDRGCESETDTEEFEKVGQSPLDLNFDKEIPSAKPGTQDASTSTEGNLEISRSEHDKLKSLLEKIANFAFQAITELKSELANVKMQYEADKNALAQHFQKLGGFCENLTSEQDLREKNLIQRMSSDHANEINDFRKLAQVKNEEIKYLRTNIIYLENKVKKGTEENTALTNEFGQERAALERKILSLEAEKEKCVREVTEKLSREHKNEIKTLQARFKLVTMERTPSESSLEKTLEFSSLTNHEMIVSQMRDNYEDEKTKVVQETRANEAEKWQKIIEKMKEEHAQALQKKEQSLVEQIKMLNDQQMNYKIDMYAEIEILREENEKLKVEKEMVESVTTLQISRTDSATSPIKQRKSLSKSLSVSPGKMTKMIVEKDLMKKGDYVVIVWDEEHESFIVVQDGPVIHFLHPDSIAPLSLKITPGSPKKPNKRYCLGEYIEREYCHARKAGNRYKVPKDSRFFRVKARPSKRDRSRQPSPKIDIPMSQSQTSTSNRTTSESTNEPEFHSLPSSPKIDSTAKFSEGETSEIFVSAQCDNKEFTSTL